MGRSSLLLQLLVLLPAIVACEKLLIEKDQINSNENNFDLLWNTIDRNYSFFEYKDINWDSINNIYRPMVNNGITNRQLFDIMADMLFELRDGHVNLYSDFDRSKNWEWYSNYPPNFNITLLEYHYLGLDYRTIGPFKTLVIDSIGYVYCGTFSDKIRERDIDMVIEQFYDLNGIIIDVRNNSGGFSVNSKMISSRFADTRRLVSYSLYKNGPGHGDFSEPQPNYVSPDGKRQFIKPVAILSNRQTYSAANDFVLVMSAFPHITVIGDSSGGGGGTPYDSELLNGWRYRFPRTQTLAPDGFNVEDGIPPDIHVNMTLFDENRGRDTIIERAKRYLNELSRN